jgi:cytoskeletal protein RodZ
MERVFMRKLKVLAILLLAVSLFVILPGCSGEKSTKEFDFTGFTKLEIGFAFKVEITQSASYSVSVTADSNRMELIEVTKDGDTLKIDLDSSGFLLSFSTLEATITMPDLRGLKLSGASNGTIQGFSSSNEFKLNLSGASRLSGDISAGDAEFTISGASRVELQGSADDMTVDASGASSVKLSAFEVTNADVTLSGASDGTVKLDGKLDANLSGASRLTYIGEPTIGSVNTSGASTINKG